ncbi:PREDICTED: uncharacterized protein LOC107190637 [Dufourea novaeangliae]|uniref:uncharacterized protein LOC107190637 n=1 Tax=Dufourea novaeangliae TaxID=178035 RepID=UPI000767A439|nr:PREDICTED: uncharacterized protein LOC107190637 [Dufourea novaeangliae]
MSNNSCICSQCIHPVCPNPDAEPPFDEVSYEIGKNILSVKIPKKERQFQADDSKNLQQKLSFDFDCPDARGEKCKIGCSKVNVIPDRIPPQNMPDEEMFSLKSARQILYNDDLKNTLEIEFKAPRNYIPLPEFGPPPPIIVPKLKAVSRKGKRKIKRKK